MVETEQDPHARKTDHRWCASRLYGLALIRLVVSSAPSAESEPDRSDSILDFRGAVAATSSELAFLSTLPHANAREDSQANPSKTF